MKMDNQDNNNIAIKSMVVETHQLGQRLDHVISNLLPQYSRAQIKYWILNRKVVVNNQVIVLPKKKMIPGSMIEIHYLKNRKVHYNYFIVPQNIALDIIYEDNDILVINKTSNMVVYPGIRNYENTLLNALLYKYPSILKISKYAGIVQRLDKDTSGIMIIAKTCFAYDNLLKLFKMRQVIKEYDAIVFGSFAYSAGIVDKPIRRHSIKRTCMTVHNFLGKQAITHYSVIERFKEYGTRVRVLLKTGRTHQIRVHMAYINHPLIGDQKYGCSNRFFSSLIKGESNSKINYLRYFNRQALHASTIQLLHPITKKQVKWSAPLPNDILDLIKVLQS